MNRSRIISMNQDGITLIEVMVSILLFGIALGAVVFNLQANLTQADQLRNNSVAAGLAQEGIEVVRNIRDEEWIGSVPSTFGTKIPDGTYEIQWDSTDLLTNQARFLKKDSNGMFSYGLGNDTIFKRTITITTVSSEERKITVSVAWALRGVNHTLGAEAHLYNWY